MPGNPSNGKSNKRSYYSRRSSAASGSSREQLDAETASEGSDDEEKWAGSDDETESHGSNDVSDQFRPSSSWNLSDPEFLYVVNRFASLMDEELDRSGPLSERGSLKTGVPHDVGIRHDFSAEAAYGVLINEDPLDSRSSWLARAPFEDVRLDVKRRVILDHVCQTYYTLVALRHRPEQALDEPGWRPTSAEFKTWADYLTTTNFECLRAVKALRTFLEQFTAGDDDKVRFLLTDASWDRPENSYDPSTAFQEYNDAQRISAASPTRQWHPTWRLSTWSLADQHPARVVSYANGRLTQAES